MSTPETCGHFSPNYLKDLQYVSRKLFEIINNKILTGVGDYEVNLSTCYPGCMLPSRKLTCETWLTIKDLLLFHSNVDDNIGYLSTLRVTINFIINCVPHLDFGIKAQFERFLCIIKSLESRLNSICCSDKCEYVLGDFFCLLVNLLLKLISAVTRAANIIYFVDCATNAHDKTTATFFKCIVCEFINDLCSIEKLLPELSSIAIAFISCDTDCCTPCYTASCASIKNRPLCPLKIMHDPISNPYYGYSGYGCNCGNDCALRKD